ncbi:MAG: ATP-binding protein, partial [Phycisphaerae bacterium]
MKTSNRELQNRNDQLDARNRVLSGLVDCTDTALIALNANGHVLRINPAAESRFKLDTSAIGRPVSECLDRSLLDRLGQDARTDAAEYRRRVQDSQGNRYMRTARPDGDRADANIFLSFQPVEASPEEVTGHDAAQFEAVMEAVPAAVLIAHDVECRQITGNSAGYEMLNAPAGCNVSQSSRGRSRPHYRVYQNDRELSHEELPMQKACATGEAVTGVELRLVFGDGTERIVFGNAVPLFNGGHRVRGCVAAFVDISQVERVNQRVRELNRELGRMVQARASRIREQSRKVRRLAWRLAQAEQRERQRIAQMLHDHLQQLLVGAQFHIASSRRKKDPASMRQSLGDLDDLLAQALAATRDLSLELSPPVLREEGLVEASHWIAKQMREQNGLAVHVHVETHFEPAEQRERTLLFECLRELLLNVAKHSGGQRADVTLRCRGGAFEICVRDSGKGFDPESVGASHGEHFGLLSVRERIEVVGGQMHIESAPGKGTEITLQCPVT